MKRWHKRQLLVAVFFVLIGLYFFGQVFGLY